MNTMNDKGIKCIQIVICCITSNVNLKIVHILIIYNNAKLPEKRVA